jgi:hypothetical protein
MTRRIREGPIIALQLPQIQLHFDGSKQTNQLRNTAYAPKWCSVVDDWVSFPPRNCEYVQHSIEELPGIPEKRHFWMSSHDRGTIRHLGDRGVSERWHCLEVGGGGGSISEADTRRGDQRESMLLRQSRRSRRFRSKLYDCGDPRKPTVPTRVTKRSGASLSASERREVPFDS